MTAQSLINRDVALDDQTDPVTAFFGKTGRIAILDRMIDESRSNEKAQKPVLVVCKVSILEMHFFYLRYQRFLCNTPILFKNSMSVSDQLVKMLRRK